MASSECFYGQMGKNYGYYSTAEIVLSVQGKYAIATKIFFFSDSSKQRGFFEFADFERRQVEVR